MGEVGRPTVMTPETISKLDEAFSVGATDLEACFVANIGKDSLYRYIQEHPEYSDRKEALKNMPKFKAKKVVTGKIDQGDEKVSQWYLERKVKEEFSARNELTAADGKDLTINVINYGNKEQEVDS